MINLKLDIRLKSRLKLKCDKHPTFNPEKHGVQGYKANCPKCREVSEMFLLWQRLRNAISDYETLTKPFETYKPPVRKKSTEASPELTKALNYLMNDKDKDNG